MRGECATGVVHQDVDRPDLVADLLGQRADLVQFGEVGGQRGGAGVGGDRRQLLGRPADDDEIDLRSGQGTRRDGADAVAGAGDHDGSG